VIDAKRILRVLLSSIMALAAVIANGATVPVFREGKILLPVVIAADVAPEERAAAEELALGLGLMSGLRWPVLTEASPNATGFHFGRTRLVQHSSGLKVATDLLAPREGEIGPDGFRIHTENGSVFIEGATPEATGFAAAWLLQHYGGIRRRG